MTDYKSDSPDWDPESKQGLVRDRFCRQDTVNCQTAVASGMVLFRHMARQLPGRGSETKAGSYREVSLHTRGTQEP